MTGFSRRFDTWIYHIHLIYKESLETNFKLNPSFAWTPEKESYTTFEPRRSKVTQRWTGTKIRNCYCGLPLRVYKGRGKDLLKSLTDSTVLQRGENFEWVCDLSGRVPSVSRDGLHCNFLRLYGLQYDFESTVVTKMWSLVTPKNVVTGHPSRSCVNTSCLVFPEGRRPDGEEGSHTVSVTPGPSSGTPTSPSPSPSS